MKKKGKGLFIFYTLLLFATFMLGKISAILKTHPFLKYGWHDILFFVLFVISGLLLVRIIYQVEKRKYEMKKQQVITG
ncbi:hypothetical protein L1765_01085 [Microaerobacter geothermalis]|uniref:hypothetical protein n=1 Tax=Microaerobacter geothermalis TaxID=674972 RepID=UPI001F3ABF2D|nr:hypothetical protein [Microaerobacter geothermalis]MCF6092587.1 hypothetical protein [Microaerobacter geothermalis]